MNTYLIISETIYNINKKIEELSKDIPFVVNFNLDENTIDEVLQEASYFSMFDEKKCIIVKNAKLFVSSKKEESNHIKEDNTKLLKYLENENKNTKLIFICSGKCDTKKKIYNILNNVGNVYTFVSMTKTNMKNELLKYVESKGYKIEDKSLWHIINNSLGNFDICLNEINKIMLYYSKACNIKYDDVLILTSKSIEDNNFKLVDAIINKDLDNSIKLLNDAKILKIEPNIILSLIYREFKLMLSLIILESKKVNKKDVLSELNIFEWQYDKVKKNLYNYKEREIKEEIVKLSNLDYKCKSGLLDKTHLLINYILDLCS